MQLELDAQEVQSLVNVLGELPTKSNAYPLLVKIMSQAKGQLEVIETPVDESQDETEAA